ncbi:MAG TPA: ABC transporter substrate-binding protein [Chloroflexota bacterium]|nr:ABC transporter substrate-binding protein [Chloroflexota bacterium]
MSHRLFFCLACCVIVGCTSAVTTARDESPAGSRQPPEAQKSLTVGILVSVKSYGPWDGTTGGGAVGVSEIHTMGLVSEDLNGHLEPRLAAMLPSVDDGTIVVLPDGRMQTTWRLRPGVTWHDGVPFTASDLVFSGDVLRDPDIAATVNSIILKADSVEAPDPGTLVITWHTTFYRALDLIQREFWPLPQHILADPYREDKQSFLGHRYFTTDYVNLGPFRLVDFGLGEQQVFERYDDYFLGRPKVSQIVIKTIANAQALVAALKAGALDIVAEKTLPGDMAAELRDEYRDNGEGELRSRQDNWLYGAFQLGAQWARPEGFAQDVRVRRALFAAIDRDAIRDAMLPGFPDTSGDSFMPRSDPRFAAVGEPFAQYRYDTLAAAQELAAAGWRRGSDGHLLGADGRQVQIEVIAANDTWAKEVALVADYWRQIGLDVTENIPSRAVARDDERMAAFSGLILRARGSADGIFVSFDSRLQAGPQNRWSGANLEHYVNPAMDQLIDTLYSQIDERQQGATLKQMGEVLATDLPALPLYYRPTFTAVRKGVRALAEFGATRDPGAMSKAAHLWDRD